MKPETKVWIDIAERDFAGIDATLNYQLVDIFDLACYHAQQCAEKYLKAYLNEQGIALNKTHELQILLNQCLAADASFSSILGQCSFLNPYVIIFRYPGDPTIPAVPPTRTRAQLAQQAAADIRAFVRSKLGI